MPLPTEEPQDSKEEEEEDDNDDDDYDDENCCPTCLHSMIFSFIYYIFTHKQNIANSISTITKCD